MKKKQKEFHLEEAKRINKELIDMLSGKVVENNKFELYKHIILLVVFESLAYSFIPNGWKIPIMYFGGIPFATNIVIYSCKIVGDKLNPN